MQTMSMAPNLAAQDYMDFGQLMNVGGMVEGKGQEFLGDQISRYNFGQGERDEALARYMAAIGGNYGGVSTGTQSQPMYGGNPLIDALGLGLAGAGLFL